jgi:hypothetical protein
MLQVEGGAGLTRKSERIYDSRISPLGLFNDTVDRYYGIQVLCLLSANYKFRDLSHPYALKSQAIIL